MYLFSFSEVLKIKTYFTKEVFLFRQTISSSGDPDSKLKHNLKQNCKNCKKVCLTVVLKT